MIVRDIKLKNDDNLISLMTFPLYVTEMTNLGTTVDTDTTKLYNKDGAILNSEHVGVRTITMTLQNFDKQHTTHSDWIYSYFQIKKDLSLLFYGTNDSGEEVSRRIDCRVNKISPSSFTEDDVYKIQLFCLDPFFHDETIVLIRNYYSTPEFEFIFECFPEEPFEVSTIRSSNLTEINNIGQTSVGFITTIIAKSPFKGCKIVNLETREFLECRPELEVAIGQKLIFDTRNGNRGLFLYDEVSGETTNQLYHVASGTTWFELPVGVTTLGFEITEGDLDLIDLSFEYDICFGGL